MKVQTFADPAAFLEVVHEPLERNEVANGVILGVCARMARGPKPQTTPCLKTVEDESRLVMAAMITPPHKLVVYGEGNVEEGAKALVESLVREGWPVPGVLGSSETAAEVAKRWKEATGQRYELWQRQQGQEVRKVAVPVPEQGRLRAATEADLELVARWRDEFEQDIWGKGNPEESREEAVSQIGRGNVYLWEEGQPVSMALTTRPITHGISISWVYTPPALRNKGYATACVGELSRMLLSSGWEYCSLFVNTANPAAVRAYEKVGYRVVCDQDEYNFLQ